VIILHSIQVLTIIPLPTKIDLALTAACQISISKNVTHSLNHLLLTLHNSIQRMVTTTTRTTRTITHRSIINSTFHKMLFSKKLLAIPMYFSLPENMNILDKRKSRSTKNPNLLSWASPILISYLIIIIITISKEVSNQCRFTLLIRSAAIIQWVWTLFLIPTATTITCCSQLSERTVR